MAEPTFSEPNAAQMLIVEDEPEMRRMVRDALQRIGYRVCAAEDLPAARQAIRETPIELVLTDIKLGTAESGIDLLHELALRSPDIAVVMMTGSTAIQTAIDCLRDGAFDYLVKPFTTDELKAVLSRALQRRRNMIAERDRVEEQLRTLGKFPSENPYPVLRVARDSQILYANAASQALLNELRCSVGQKVPPFLAQLIDDVFGQ